MIDSVDKLLIRDLSERFRTDIESINFKIDEELIPISISIGVAFYKESDTQESLVERADKAMYHAKKSGRNIVKTEEQLSSNKL
jgi:diguanylate cyclase (GGDEF)-like protein